MHMQQLQRLKKSRQVSCPDHAKPAQQRVRTCLVARQRRCMRHRGGPCLMRSAKFQRHNRFAQLAGLGGEGLNGAQIAKAFNMKPQTGDARIL